MIELLKTTVCSSADAQCKISCYYDSTGIGIKHCQKYIGSYIYIYKIELSSYLIFRYHKEM